MARSWRVRTSPSVRRVGALAAAAALAGGCAQTGPGALQLPRPAPVRTSPLRRSPPPTPTPTSSPPITRIPTATATVTATATPDIGRGGGPTSASPIPPPATTPSTPAAGADPFVGRRIVAYYGAPGTTSLGVLGQGSPAQAWGRLNAQAISYDTPGHPALRCFEVIATVASSTPGSGGLYRNRVAASAIAPYLATVRAHGGELLLDIQPGRSNFLDEAEALEPLLLQPDVGLALDPEWRMGPDQLPGKVIGSVSAAEVNEVSSWLENLTVSHHLPDKLFVLHEFTEPELTDEDDIVNRPHLHEILNVDGFGSVAVKLAVYHRLSRLSPFAMGLKLFYRQDPVLMAPHAVESLSPQAQLVDYE